MSKPNLRIVPLRIEPLLTRDFINRAVKMREIQDCIVKAERRRGWKLVAVWALAIVGSWALVGALGYLVWRALGPVAS